MTPLEYFDASFQNDAWHLQLPTDIHGAFGGVTGGALAAAAIALGRTIEPGRVAAGIDIHFLRGLSTTGATVKVTTLSSGRSLAIVRAEFSDASGKPTTEARVAFAAPETLRTDIHTADRDAGLLGPPPSDLSTDAKPWRKPEGVEVPIIDTARPRAARVGGSIATLITIPWDATDDGSEGSCLAADLSVGPPVDAAIPKGTWVPHPNPDLSLRFSGPVTHEDLVAVAVCREISGGLATVETEVWQEQSLVAKGISTSLLLAKS
ncbi:MAG: acyl-CoA thioesterase domain-containing protein [Actinomycetota bacterium]|nr:acyl-CoA thioesterase domain-containing protein [Actinomycetota bacterium]